MSDNEKRFTRINEGYTTTFNKCKTDFIVFWIENLVLPLLAPTLPTLSLNPNDSDDTKKKKSDMAWEQLLELMPLLLRNAKGEVLTIPHTPQTHSSVFDVFDMFRFSLKFSHFSLMTLCFSNHSYYSIFQSTLQIRKFKSTIIFQFHIWCI